MGREVGGGIGMGKTCEPKAFLFQCMTEFTTNKKKNKVRELLNQFALTTPRRKYFVELLFLSFSSNMNL